MSGRSGRWWRLAVKLVRHAASMLPGAQSPWGDAMRRELDYIADDPAALRWALGCILASYKARLSHRPRLSGRTAWRYAGASGVLMLLALVSLQGHARGQTEPTPPAFHQTACDLPNISQEVRPRLRCGTVSVPRDYARPDAGQFNLAVVVIKSAQPASLPDSAVPDPVVYISGGPGEPLTIYADPQARTPYAPGRDLILVDQRGTGRSEPELCPELESKLLEANLAVAADDSDAALASRRATYSACRDEVIARGLDPRDFGTRVTVEDLERVRQALGVERWNVYGESYGTTVAMTLVALHPEHVRSVVLDSVYPPDPMPRRSTAVAGALDAFFAYCARDKVCSTSFPSLAATYRAALEGLERTPLLVAVPPRLHRPNDQVPLTPSLFEALVGNLIYYPTAYPGLPRLIAAVHDGDTRGVGPALAAVLTMASTQNCAANAAVECRDRPHYRDPLPAGANVLDRVELRGICDGWSGLGAPPLVPTGTDVPILVLAGQFDPVAGPTVSRHVAEMIGTSGHWVEFPRVGHNVRHFSPCGARVVADFIDRPTQALDKSCAERRPPIQFLPKYQAP